MSMIGGSPQEHGEKIADFATYQGAQKAVSQLIQADIPARDIAIVGHGLRSSRPSPASSATRRRRGRER
jgi:hypothetical protein